MKPISLILWDFDGTLSLETPPVKESFVRAARGAVRDTLPQQLTEQATDDVIDHILKKSRDDYGDSFTWLKMHGLSEKELHENHHKRLDASLLKPNAALVRSFKKLERTGVMSAILTHGHMIWTAPALEKCGLRPFFPDERIITAEKIDFLKKHRGPEAFKMALEQLGITAEPEDLAEEVAFVEDKPKNLYFPKEFSWMTYLVTHGNPDKTPYVDVRCQTPEDVIGAILEHNYAIEHDYEHAAGATHNYPLALLR